MYIYADQSRLLLATAYSSLAYDSKEKYPIATKDIVFEGQYHTSYLLPIHFRAAYSNVVRCGAVRADPNCTRRD